MRTSPTQSELAMLNELCSDELFHYAITRIIECEEVWGLLEDDGWMIQQQRETSYITIWPYQCRAKAYAESIQSNRLPHSTSLEDFVYRLLNQCAEQDIQIEVFARPTQAGKIVSASNLSGLLEGMMESGEYYMEG